MDIVTLSKAKKYTDSSIAGIDGIIAGKNCKIQSVEDITNGHRITFSWNDDEGVARTSTLDVMDGRGIESIEIKYASSSSGTTPPSEWQTTPPEVPSGSYLWTRNVITYTTGDTDIEYLVGRQGIDGISPVVTVTETPGNHVVTITDKTGPHPFTVKDGYAIDHIEVHYAGSDSGTVIPVTGWQDTPPQVPTGNYLWTRNTSYLEDGTTAKTYMIALQGAPGISPDVETTQVSGGTRVTITDKDGQHQFTVLNGIDGTDGRDGADGQDGFSPIITTNKVGKTTTITIVDATGTKYATVLDGADGKTITNITINSNNHVIVTYSDGTTSDAGELIVQSTVMSVNGQTGDVTLDLPDVVNIGDNLSYDSTTNTLSADAQEIAIDLPTDAIIHYSFDEIPDIPDGANIVLNNKDFSLTEWKPMDGWTGVNIDSEGRLYTRGVASYYVNIYKEGVKCKDASGKYFLAKLYISAASAGTPRIYLTKNGSETPDGISGQQTLGRYGWYFVCLKINENVREENLFIHVEIGGNGYCLFEWIYIGDLSYNTPIIENAHGANVANHSIIAAQGVSGKAAFFIGSDSYIQGTFPQLSSSVYMGQTRYQFVSNLSISCWVSNWVKRNESALVLINSGTPFPYLKIFFSAPENDLMILWRIKDSDNNFGTYYFYGNNLNFENWFYEKTHVVALFEETTAKLYINNVCIDLAVTGPIQDQGGASGDYIIGTDGSSHSCAEIDDYQIFDRILTESEIAALYQNRGNTPKYYTLADYIKENGIDSPEKADKVTNAVSGHFAGLDSTGNLTDSGKSASDFLPADTPIPSAQIQSDWNQSDNTQKDFIKNKPTIPAAQVNSDWDSSSGVSQILNKPTLGTAAFKDVPSSGDASTTQVVLGNDSRLSDARNAADVYDWAKASTKPSYSASEVGAIATTLKGTANGVAELDVNGLVPSSQLPSYVDDVLEYSTLSAFPATGQTGKIYVALDTNLTYRWSGSVYVEISPSLALGETSSTAYRGDRGKTAYDHSQLTNGNPHNVTKSEIGLGNVGNFKAVSTEVSQELTSAEQSNARTNIGLGNSATKDIGTASGTVAAGDHTHQLSLTTGGTSTIDLSLSTTYTLTAGGNSVAFKMPGDHSGATDTILVGYGSEAPSGTSKFRLVTSITAGRANGYQALFSPDTASINYSEGTVNSEGVTSFELGNSIPTGAANNQTGELKMYGSKGDSATMKYNSNTQAIEFIFN